MKKFFFILISLLMAIVMLNANTLYVGDGQQYTTIQSAIDASVSGDSILVYSGTYDNIHILGEKSLTISSREMLASGMVTNTYITGHGTTDCVNINTNNSVVINGFLIHNGLDGIRSYQPMLPQHVTTEIKNCIIYDNKYMGINYINGTDNHMIIDKCTLYENPTSICGHGWQHIDISNSIIKDSNIGFYFRGTEPMGGNNDRIFVEAKITNCKIYDISDRGVVIDWGNVHIDRSLFTTANKAIEEIYYGSGIFQYCTIENSTFSNNNIVFSNIHQNNQGERMLKLQNCIIWNNQNNSIESHSEVTYSDIQGGFTGTGNIAKDPKFSTNPSCHYYLVEGSPCIDAGDPNLTDADGTRLDMGCYSTANLDLKELQGNHWNWVSFPRLPRDGNDPVNAPSILSQMIPMPGSMEMFRNTAHLFYDNNVWAPADYTIVSDLGYKLNPEEDGTFTLPEHGTRLPADFTTPIYANQHNWIGYWLPQTQSVQDALGSQLDHIIGIKAENWYMKKVNGQWEGGISSTKATFEYGRGYEIIADRDFDLQWQLGSISPAFKSEATENFNYTQKADYEMIDIDTVDGAENVTEIGAFVDGVCVGASKVTEYPVHIQAYTDAVNRGSEFTFEIVTGRSVKKVVNVQKYNFYNATFENASVYPTGKGFTKIRLSVKSNPENTVSPVRLESNYPNPFSISGKRGSMGTTIAFTIPENENVKLTIYNIKGQKVKSLLDKACTKGRTSIIWNGNDNNNRKVSSGVYFYRLETKQKSINKKMILVK